MDILCCSRRLLSLNLLLEVRFHGDVSSAMMDIAKFNPANLSVEAAAAAAYIQAEIDASHVITIVIAAVSRSRR